MKIYKKENILELKLFDIIWYICKVLGILLYLLCSLLERYIYKRDPFSLPW